LSHFQQAFAIAQVLAEKDPMNAQAQRDLQIIQQVLESLNQDLQD